MHASQEEIDLAVRQYRSPRPEKAVSVKSVVSGVGLGTVILAAGLKLWVGNLAALPFTYTKDWHDQVQHNLEVSADKFTEIEVLKAEQVNTNVAISEIKKSQERQADDAAAMRRILERIDRRSR